MYESYLQSLVLQSNRSQQGWKCKTAPFKKKEEHKQNFDMWKCSTLVDARKCKYSRGGVKLTDRSELPLSNFAPVKELAKMMGDDHLYDYHGDYRRPKERNVLFLSIELNHHGVFQIVYAAVNHSSCLTRRPEPWALVTINPSTLFHRGQNHLHL